MDDNQFRDLIKCFNDQHTATLNVQMANQDKLISELVKTLSHSQRDHDAITRIEAMLDNYLVNCCSEKKTNKEHRDESVIIRDMVKKNDRIVGGFCKFGWMIVAALIVVVQTVVGWYYSKR